MKDTYNTIALASEESLIKEKSSKFFGYAFPITAEEEVKPIIESLKKKHPQAVHYCYAYQLGPEKQQYRANDDGEPSGSAGIPIYGQIQSFGLTNILIVVVRIYGGIKLGVGGLIAAYKSSAQLTIESCEIIEKTIDVRFLLLFEYIHMNKVMRVIKEKKLEILEQQLEIDKDTQLAMGKIVISSRKKNAEMVFDTFSSIYEIIIKKL